jgi:hypothetical protein
MRVELHFFGFKKNNCECNILEYNDKGNKPIPVFVGVNRIHKVPEATVHGPYLAADTILH